MKKALLLCGISFLAVSGFSQSNEKMVTRKDAKVMTPQATQAARVTPKKSETASQAITPVNGTATVQEKKRTTNPKSNKK